MTTTWNWLESNPMPWHEPGAIRSRMAMFQVRKQIESFATFIPDLVLKTPLHRLNEIQKFVGVILHVSISGFTALCEQYNKISKGGIHQLTATLNAYVGAIVESIMFFGGDIVEYSGETLLAVWKTPPEVHLYKAIHETVSCGLFLQQTLGSFETKSSIVLKMKIAISCGTLSFSLNGNGNFRHFVLVGRPVDDAKNADRICSAGDVVLAMGAWGHLSEDSYLITYVDCHNVKVHKICYSSNKQFDKQAYQKKHELAATLCDKHLAHWNLTHARRQLGAISDTKITKNFVESLPCRSTVGKAAETWILNQLTSFVISPVQNQIYDNQSVDHLTEMREVTVQFVRIELGPELNSDQLIIARVSKICQIVWGIVSKARGVFLKLHCFDRRVNILSAFGLGVAKLELDSQSSLKSAYLIRTETLKVESVQNVSVGITYGLVYCGVTGHPFRRDYILIGKPVNKAVQMTSLHPDILVCDQETYRSSKLCSSYFRLLQSSQQMDETLGLVGHVFEYNEDDFNSIVEGISKDDQVSLTGRQTEMDLMNLVIESPEKIGSYHGICFRGSSKIGKTQLLHQGLTKYKKQTTYVAAIDLQTTIQRPYFCISRIYKQLYDMACLKDPHVIEDLPRHLWNYSDILEDSSGLSRKNYVTRCFTKLCKSVTSDCVLIFVDNVQCIDAKSFEIIDAILRTKSARFICAGDFEQKSYWDTMWRISLSNQVKVVDVEGLDYESQLRHICDYLNVIGISHKLFDLIREVCNGRPGWIQTCLERLVNSGEIDIDYAAKDPQYVFRYDICETSSVLVADLSEVFSQRTQDMTLATISLELIDSAKPQVQLAIKIASVLGNIFTRNVLSALLECPSVPELAGTIENLFDRGIFECASRYISECDFQQYTTNCLCYTEDQEVDTTNFPRYSFCKLIHFKNMDLKTAVYEILPADEKVNYHSKITDLLELQNNSCPNCLRHNFEPIINLPTFRDVMRCCNEDYNNNNNKEVFRGNCGDSTEIVKDIIRQGIVRGFSQETSQTDVQVYVPRQQIWDSTTCFCLEILLNSYVDLIHHSYCAQSLEKRVFYMLQYAFLLTKINELEDAIPILSEASEICMIEPLQQTLSDSFRKVMIAKIHTLLSHVYLKMSNLTAAKNHVVISLKQYNVPMISFKCTVPRTILNHGILLALNSAKTSTTLNNDMIRNDFGLTLRIAGSIFAAEHKWSYATTLSMRSLSLLKSSKCTLDVLCEAYCLAIEMHNFCGKDRVCLALEKKFHRDISRYTPRNLVTEISAVTKLVMVMFQAKTMQGQINNSIRHGFKVLELNMAMQAYQLQIQFVPVLATLLVQVQRIDEAVCLARILLGIGMKHDVQGLVAYYAFCIELIVDTNFFLEPLEQIENFAGQYYNRSDSTSKQSLNRSDLDDKLLVYLRTYSLKILRRRSKWSKFSNWDIDRDHCTILSVCNLLKATECVLIELFLSTNRNKVFELTKAKFYLGKCQEVAEKWRFFMPRYLHYKAYLMQIEYKTKKSFRTLTRALAFAREQGNVLEQSWMKLQSNVWEGGFGFSINQMNSVHWRLAKTYSPLQWSQIMCPLPI